MPTLPKEPFDPKLKAAMEEIKGVLAKYDCAASVVLQSPAHVEHLLNVSPSWSCLTIEPDGRARFKCAMKTGDADEKERGRVTTGMVMGFIDSAEMLRENFLMIAKMLGNAGLDIEHVSRFTPHAPSGPDLLGER
jgi:hypothetical protein